MTQYEVIPLEETTPPSYERVFRSSGAKVFPPIVNDGGEVEELADGRRRYAFSGAAGTGYRKSTIVFSSGADTGSGSAYISIRNTSSGFRVTRSNDYGIVETAIYTSLDITYTVSNPPSGAGSSGSVTISPMTKFNEYAIKPARVDGVSAESETKTFLVKTGAVQSLDDDEGWGNYAFDIE